MTVSGMPKMKTKLTPDMYMEVLLVHGDSMTGLYWDEVFEWMLARWPDLFHGTAYPHTMGKYRTEHSEHDMAVLTEIHRLHTHPGYREKALS